MVQEAYAGFNTVAAYETLLDHYFRSKFYRISIRWLKGLIHVLNALSMWKVNFEKKIWYFPLRNFHLLYTLLFNVCSIICPVVAYRMLKRKENFKFLSLKVVTVAYKRWSLACVASVSRRFGSKELQGVLFWLSQHFPCRQNTKNPVPWSFFAPKPYGNACYAG